MASTAMLQNFKLRSGFKTNNDPSLTGALEAAARFAADINHTEPYWLSFLGKSGVGKTHLARRIFRHFMGVSRFDLSFNPERNRIEGNTGNWCNWRKLCASVREGNYGWVEDLCEDWFVVLDDIGTEYDSSGHLASVLDRIIAGRKKKWTVLTVNLSLEQISEKLDPRIASRMLRDGGQIVDMSEATDYSLRNL